MSLQQKHTRVTVCLLNMLKCRILFMHSKKHCKSVSIWVTATHALEGATSIGIASSSQFGRPLQYPESLTKKNTGKTRKNATVKSITVIFRYWEPERFRLRLKIKSVDICSFHLSYEKHIGIFYNIFIEIMVLLRKVL